MNFDERSFEACEIKGGVAVAALSTGKAFEGDDRFDPKIPEEGVEL